jgi:hypothetical protein
MRRKGRYLEVRRSEVGAPIKRRTNDRRFKRWSQPRLVQLGIQRSKMHFSFFREIHERAVGLLKSLKIFLHDNSDLSLIDLVCIGRRRYCPQVDQRLDRLGRGTEPIFHIG